MWSCWNSEFRWFVGWRRVLLSFSLLVQRDRSFSSSELCCVTCHAFVWRVYALTWCVLRPKKTSEPLSDPPTGLRFPCKSSIQKNRRNNYACLHSANSTADVVETFSQVAGKNAAQTFQNTSHWQEQREDYQGAWSDQIRMARLFLKKNGITKVIMSRVREDHG